jgi:hypothetical protein
MRATSIPYSTADAPVSCGRRVRRNQELSMGTVSH